jgi:hypothetical protein
MKKTAVGTTGNQIGNLFTFMLVAVFVILALFLAVVGIQDYQSVLDSNEKNTNTRVSMSYIANKIRACDAAGQVSVLPMDGGSVLILREDAEDEYHTRIYYYDGMLYEQSYDAADGEFLREDGQGFVEAKAFSVDMDAAGLLSVRVTTPDDKPHQMYVAVRSVEP